MLCTHKTTILCQLGLFRHKLTTISPSIFNHFLWELYQINKSHHLTPTLTSPINALFNEKTILSEEEDSESEQEQHNFKHGSSPKLKTMSTLIAPTPAANKSAEQHQEPSEQDSCNHLLYNVLRLTSQQVQDLNGWMEHRGIPNVHEVIAQNCRCPHTFEDNLKVHHTRQKHVTSRPM